MIIKDRVKGNQYPKFGKPPIMNKMFPNFAKVTEFQNQIFVYIFHFMLSKQLYLYILQGSKA